MTRPQALFALQQVDTEIDNRLAKIAKIDVALNDNQALLEAQQHLAGVEKTLRAATSHQKDLEYQAQETTAHADQLEKRLYGGEINGAKESEKAQTEIATFRNRRKELDDKLLAATVAVEGHTQELQEAKEQVATIEAELKQTHAGLVVERQQLEDELPALRAERDKRRMAIVTPDMALYDKLRATKNGSVVAQVENSGKICGKCRVDLPAGKIRDVKVLTSVITCPSCGRILFYK